MKYPSLFARLLANSEPSEDHYFRGSPCWCWTGWTQRRGYPGITMRVDGQPRRHLAHRVMAELAIGRKLDPILETIEHACTWTWCVNYSHFDLATRAENTADMRARLTGGSRRVFKPLIDPAVWYVDPFERALPVKRELEVCPF